jgi:hypothetical protein
VSPVVSDLRRYGVSTEWRAALSPFSALCMRKFSIFVCEVETIDREDGILNQSFGRTPVSPSSNRRGAAYKPSSWNSRMVVP